MKHLIIGCGPAALSAAATLRKADPAGKVTILSRERVKPYARMALPYLLAGKVEEKDFFLTEPEGTELLLGEEAERVDPQGREVATASGKRFAYDRLLIATGATPERPTIDGVDLPFVFTVRDLADVKGIRERLPGQAGRAVIAGAGPVGMELGDALHGLGMAITFVVASNRVFSTILDTPAAEFVGRKLEEKGIEILTTEDIVRIGRNGEVLLKSGGTRQCDIVILGKGVAPCIPFLAGSGIAVGRGVRVDDRQETSCPGIYAAGDVVETKDIVYGDRRVNALWPVAVEQGRVAGLNMAGVPTVYPGGLSRNILRVFGLSILTAGRGRDEGPDVRRSKTGENYHKIVLDRGALVGMIFVGEARGEGLYTALMKSGTDVSPYADLLLKRSYCYSRHLARSMRLI